LEILIVMPKSRLLLKITFAIGTGLLVLGFVLFMQSLGSGGGGFALSLMLVGAVCVVASTVLMIVIGIRKART
jgi:hypothetical protein